MSKLLNQSYLIEMHFGSDFQRQIFEAQIDIFLGVIKTKMEGSHKYNEMTITKQFVEVEND